MLCSSSHCLESVMTLSRVEVEIEFDGIVDDFLDLGRKVAVIAKVVIKVERIVAGYSRIIIEIIAIDIRRFLLLCSQLHLMNEHLFFRLVKKSEIVNHTRRQIFLIGFDKLLPGFFR